mmetsp:Transcript_3642/g.7614  ORF Transcript_3642/g.7614 Transcript_3642/m.7614 type:complete len:224 (+) Transcript_3642:109-780(+)
MIDLRGISLLCARALSLSLSEPAPCSSWRCPACAAAGRSRATPLARVPLRFRIDCRPPPRVASCCSSHRLAAWSAACFDRRRWNQTTPFCWRRATVEAPVPSCRWFRIRHAPPAYPWVAGRAGWGAQARRLPSCTRLPYRVARSNAGAPLQVVGSTMRGRGGRRVVCVLVVGVLLVASIATRFATPAKGVNPPFSSATSDGRFVLINFVEFGLRNSHLDPLVV